MAAAVYIENKSTSIVLLVMKPGFHEGGREIRPWNHRIEFDTQVIRKIYTVPLRFHSEPLMLSSKPLNLKSVKKCFMSYLNLKTNSVDYPDSVHFVAMFKFWNI